jgi:hypothetical protein
MKIDDVVAVHREAQLAVVEADAAGQRVAQVALADRPPFVAGPIKARAVLTGDVGVDAEAAGAGAGVVLLADVRKVDVADLVLVIERHQQPSVPDGNVTRHVRTTFLAKGAACASVLARVRLRTRVRTIRLRGGAGTPPILRSAVLS